jgi:hypothetical protein
MSQLDGTVTESGILGIGGGPNVDDPTGCRHRQKFACPNRRQQNLTMTELNTSRLGVILSSMGPSGHRRPRRHCSQMRPAGVIIAAPFIE